MVSLSANAKQVRCGTFALTPVNRRALRLGQHYRLRRRRIPGRPLGMKHAHADVCAALHGVFGVVSALYRRRHTGEGQYIDLSMLRATVATMGAGLIEYEMTGRVMRPRVTTTQSWRHTGTSPAAGRLLAVCGRPHGGGMARPCRCHGQSGLGWYARIRQPIRPATAQARTRRPLGPMDRRTKTPKRLRSCSNPTGWPPSQSWEQRTRCSANISGARAVFGYRAPLSWRRTHLQHHVEPE